MDAEFIENWCDAYVMNGIHLLREVVGCCGHPVLRWSPVQMKIGVMSPGFAKRIHSPCRGAFWFWIVLKATLQEPEGKTRKVQHFSGSKMLKENWEFCATLALRCCVKCSNLIQCRFLTLPHNIAVDFSKLGNTKRSAYITLLYCVKWVDWLLECPPFALVESNFYVSSW